MLPGACGWRGGCPVLDEREGTGERLALVRHFFDHRSMHVRIRQFWEPMIIAELDDTAEAWRSAFDQLAAQPAPAHLRPYAGLRLGQHLVAGRERVEAKEVLRDGQKMRRARLDPGRSDFSAAQRAGFAVAPSTKESPVAGLTPRELEVLQLVAAGRSNGEIGSPCLSVPRRPACMSPTSGQARGQRSREAAALAHRVGLTPA